MRLPVSSQTVLFLVMVLPRIAHQDPEPTTSHGCARQNTSVEKASTAHRRRKIRKSCLALPLSHYHGAHPPNPGHSQKTHKRCIYRRVAGSANTGHRSLVSCTRRASRFGFAQASESARFDGRRVIRYITGFRNMGECI